MGAGLVVMFGGYWLAYFGFCSLRGPGVGLLDLIVPGRDVTIPGSDSTTSSSTGGGGAKLPAGTAPKGQSGLPTPAPGTPGSPGYNPRNPNNLPGLPGYNPQLPTIT